MFRKSPHKDDDSFPHQIIATFIDRLKRQQSFQRNFQILVTGNQMMGSSLMYKENAKFMDSCHNQLSTDHAET